MVVEAYCSRCLENLDDYNPSQLEMSPMIAVGPLTISQDKTQSQEYMCPKCNTYIRILINTTKEKE